MLARLLSALILLSSCSPAFADTPGQVINKLCATHTWFSQIQPGPGNINCTQPSYADLSGSAPATVWGTITGTLSNQTDLQSALNAKQATGNYITALTSDVTASGPGSVAATIASNAVSNAKFRQSAALSVVGNSTNATANVADIAAASDGQVIRRSGTAIGFGAVNLASANAVTGTLPNGNTTGSASAGASTLALRDANGVVELQVMNPINQQSGTTYTLVAADNGKTVQFTSGSAITLTIPSGLGAKFNCLIDQEGAGQITFSASGTTLHNAHSLTKTFGQYSVATVLATAANVFTLSGDMQ